jgi:N12 class adenine-specific DNA methylase
VAKAKANLAALRLLREVQAGGRPASSAERTLLARWAGWGALPEVFDHSNMRWEWARSELAGLVDDDGWRAAERSTINAHYTSADMVEAMWAAVGRLGFTAGRVLEPGCGSGNFIGARPAGLDARWFTGVELDPTTAAIAAALYPLADIRAESFADTGLGDGTFDLVIGNVPFADVVLHDRVHNPQRLAMHNHFIVKSLALTRPGGVAALITSRWTMDARNPAARRRIGELGELLGAVRLPAGAFAAAAGTDVVCDVLILRRRDPQSANGSAGWETVVPVEVAGTAASINQYFVAHPEHVLGDLVVGPGPYGRDDLIVRGRPGSHGAAAAAEALAGIAETAVHANLGWVPPTGLGPARPPEREAPRESLGSHLKEGSLTVTGGGDFARVRAGTTVAHPAARSARAELRAVLEVRDALAATLDAQTVSADDEVFGAVQRRLNRAYDAYVDRFGPLSRFALARTGRVDPDSGEEVMRRRYPAMGGFRRLDPDYPAVLALEAYDTDTGRAEKMAVFFRRVVGARPAVLGAETATDALALCLDERGVVELSRVAELLGVDGDTAAGELGELVWTDPASGELVPAGRYLSGDVRAKLAAAEAAAGTDDRFMANVTALRQVLPADLGPDEIAVRLGTPWLDVADIEAFIADVLNVTTVMVERSTPGDRVLWAVQVPRWERASVTMTSEWGTRRADGITLIEASLEQRAVKVTDENPDGRRVVNPTETLAAREKQEALEQRFSAWLWEDPARSARLTERYNRMFNSVVRPNYHGGHLSLPGLAEHFVPRPHQRDAVWRIMSEPNVLLAHPVGSGKTATMVMAAMELRRLGLVNKPGFVVPNHMLEQFCAELIQLYPRARVLMANAEGRSAADRKELVGRCATGDWDAVVMTHSTFTAIPVALDTETAYLDAKVTEVQAAIEASQKQLTVKRMQKILARYQERQRRLLDAKRDDGATFEQSGIDYLFYDECQAAKNLAVSSAIEGMAKDGSQRASDMEMKLHVLRRRHRHRGDRARVATFATGTFVTNSVAELYVMQRFMQPDRLDQLGLTGFDAWAANFGRMVTSLELAADGGGYRPKTRFARFVNVPELMGIFAEMADIRTDDELHLPAPAVAGGRPETVTVPGSQALAEFVAHLVRRAEQVRSRHAAPGEDNMLAITNAGRAAALDLRLVGLDPDPAGGKIAAAAARIAQIWEANLDRRYLGPDGDEQSRPGSLQLVFADLSTPSDRWNAYDQLRHELTARGVPAESVRFIHDAKNDQTKAELFQACRDGHVSVLVGSTAKMGVGTNVQRRAVALHHLDSPWRPADIEQRNGRILRQGNQNPEVAIIHYVTEGSFDTFMLQTLQRKAGFIHQVARGQPDGRDLDDVGDAALTFGEIKALSTGNPLIMEKAGIESDLARLERLARAHHREQHELAARRDADQQRAQRRSAQAAAIAAALPRRVDTRGDRFAMMVAGRPHRTRADAGTALKAHLLKLIAQHDATIGPARTMTCPVGELGGYQLTADVTADRLGPAAVVRIEDLPVDPIRLDRGELTQAAPVGLIARFEHRVQALDALAVDLAAQAERLNAEADAAAARLGRPFDHAARLSDLRYRLAEIDQLLTPADDETPTEPTGADNPATGPSTPATTIEPVTAEPVTAEPGTLQRRAPSSATVRPLTRPTPGPYRPRPQDSDIAGQLRPTLAEAAETPALAAPASTMDEVHVRHQLYHHQHGDAVAIAVPTVEL